MEEAKESVDLFTADVRSRRLCGICCEKTSPYTCPRCNLFYCSVQCYRSVAHVQCSELFYRECFIAGLKDMESDSHYKSQMFELLQRMNEDKEKEEDDESCDAASDSLDSLANIDINADDVVIWSQLPESHKKRFVEMLKNGGVAELISAWRPWWCNHQAVEELSQARRSSVPRILTGLQSINRLLVSKSRPSETVRFAVICALYVYCYAARLYNGDHVSLAMESSYLITDVLSPTCILSISDVSSAIACCLVTVSKASYFISREFSVAVINDVNTIVSKRLTAAALSDCHAMMKKARKSILKESALVQEQNKERNINKKEPNCYRYKVSSTHSGVSLKPDKFKDIYVESIKEENTVMQQIDESLAAQINMTSGNISPSKCNLDESEKINCTDTQDINEHRTDCFRVQKKLEFFISWFFEYGTGLDDLLPMLECELCSLTSDLKCHTTSEQMLKQIIETNKQTKHKVMTKPLIEVIETEL